MTVSLHSRSLALVLALGASACILPDFAGEGLECPCAAGFSCDTATNTCVSGEGGSTSTLPPDTTSTGPGSGGSDGGAPGSGGAPQTGGAPGNGAGGATGGGGFGVGGEGMGGSPVTGGTCAAPVDIPDPGGVLGNTVGQGNDLVGNCFEAEGPDVVFTVTAANSGMLALSLFSAAELQLYVRTDCGDGQSQIACADKGGLNDYELLSVPVTAGQTVFVIVDGHAGEESDFSLDVTSEP